MSQRPKICLSLTGKTLAEDLAILDEYRNWIDIAEVRADYLSKDERLYLRHFPEKAGIPCILTIRRRIDGGHFTEGEASRTTLFARALAFADQDLRKNYAYIDLESDFMVPSLQDAALAFGTSVIRSLHNIKGPVSNLEEQFNRLRFTGYEIPKISCMANNLPELTSIMTEASGLKDGNHILTVLGPLGLPSRILASRTGSYLIYANSVSKIEENRHLGRIDPITLNQVYNFRSIDENTELYGITGIPVEFSNCPALHNQGYRKKGMNAVYIPIQSDSIVDSLNFADEMGIKGLSVTVPFKSDILPDLKQISADAGDTGACNTAIKRGNDWIGFNTEAGALLRALKEFLKVRTLAHRKVAIIGAGGTARAAAYVVKQLHGKACVFNRTVSKAKRLAEQFGYKYAILAPESSDLLEIYSDLIIQTTSVGMNFRRTIMKKVTEEHKGYEDLNESRTTPDIDPLYFYTFNGHESVFETIYTPDRTPMLERAENAGCHTTNGLTMLQYHTDKQFELFTGVSDQLSAAAEKKIK